MSDYIIDIIIRCLATVNYYSLPINKFKTKLKQIKPDFSIPYQASIEKHYHLHELSFIKRPSFINFNFIIQ